MSQNNENVVVTGNNTEKKETMMEKSKSILDKAVGAVRESIVSHQEKELEKAKKGPIRYAAGKAVKTGLSHTAAAAVGYGAKAYKDGERINISMTSGGGNPNRMQAIQDATRAATRR